MDGLFDITPLVLAEAKRQRIAGEAEALRQHLAAQLPGQVDIWDACAEVAAEVAEQPFAWPEPVGALYARDDVTGAMVLS